MLLHDNDVLEQTKGWTKVTQIKIGDRIACSTPLEYDLEYVEVRETNQAYCRKVLSWTGKNSLLHLYPTNKIWFHDQVYDKVCFKKATNATSGIIGLYGAFPEVPGFIRNVKYLTQLAEGYISGDPLDEILDLLNTEELYYFLSLICTDKGFMQRNNSLLPLQWVCAKKGITATARVASQGKWTNFKFQRGQYATSSVNETRYKRNLKLVGLIADTDKPVVARLRHGSIFFTGLPTWLPKIAS